VYLQNKDRFAGVPCRIKPGGYDGTQHLGIIIAGGKSEQISTEVATPYLYLNKQPNHCLFASAYERCPDIDGVIVLVDKERIESVTGMVQMFGCSKVKKIHAIGPHRQIAFSMNSKKWDDEVTLVSMHDVASLLSRRT
jgi:2-C-methyl-D-erythritol 4-phosphate cytidylyltransferase